MLQFLKLELIIIKATNIRVMCVENRRRKGNKKKTTKRECFDVLYTDSYIYLLK